MADIRQILKLNDLAVADGKKRSLRRALFEDLATNTARHAIRATRAEEADDRSFGPSSDRVPFDPFAIVYLEGIRWNDHRLAASCR